ncbi:hypothetical protein PVA45_00645 [Entomospira entomophila]|uniref:Uncharacterized protein n=1 Tax=Entomospira entomophila TaxID=2719988 RepID=A0A968G902_9SPIO|nr:hypothetical protein [Entomospira entomophilus]NIZ40030.1 hypothetical protein [Entomospira entomophilus]WDI35590.1 hypothetical protein PVA45_00645 [Entomospira entomophilus]
MKHPLYRYLTILSLLLIAYSHTHAQAVGAGGKVAKLSTTLPNTGWEMRIIEIGPTRDFFGSISNIYFDSDSTVRYQRHIHMIRGNFSSDSNGKSGVITLFDTPYEYTIKGNTLYYKPNQREVALLRRIEDPIQEQSNPTSNSQTSGGSADSAIEAWLNNNTQPEQSQPTVKPQSSHALANSQWQLIDLSNSLINAKLVRELQWKPQGPVNLSVTNNGSIIIDTKVSASGTLSIGDQRSTTIILSYTDTGWNRVIGKDRLVRLELKTSEGRKVLYHMVSDDGRSIYPAIIRRMGDDEPSYAHVNRTHVFSLLPPPSIETE